MQEFLKIHNWRVTSSAWEELKSNSKAINRKVAVLYSGGCICIKEILLYKSVATADEVAIFHGYFLPFHRENRSFSTRFLTPDSGWDEMTATHSVGDGLFCCS